MAGFNTNKALNGASVGSSFGPWGALAGGVHGGINDSLPRGLRKVLDPLGLHGGGGGSRGDNEFRNVDMNAGRNAAYETAQRRLMSRLEATAQGRGVSLADMAARQAMDQGRAQLESLAVTDRRNPALARRNAMIQGGQLSARIGQQAMLGRLQEQQAAEQALAQAIQNAQAAELDRARMIEQARTNRFNALMGVPSAGEMQSAQNATNLAMLGQNFGTWQKQRQKQRQAQQQLAQQQAQNQAAVNSVRGDALSDNIYQSNLNAPQGTWVSTGPYGHQGYWKP